MPGSLNYFGWMRHASGWCLFLFFCTTLFLEGANQQRVLGILLCGSFILSCVNKGQWFWLKCPPPEMIIQSFWVVWGGVTGICVADNIYEFWEVFRVVAEVLILMWVVYGMITIRPEMVHALFGGLLVGSVILIGSAFTGEAQLQQEVDERVMGITSNPNNLALYLTIIFVLAFWYWGELAANKKWWRFLFLPYWAISIVTITMSGSRKSLIGIVVVLIAWFGWASTLKTSPARIFVRLLTMAIMIAMAFMILPKALEDTNVGKRFAKFYDQGNGSITGAAEDNIRYQMYQEGWNMTLENPVFGVGLGNFGQHFWTGQYSHSNYMEPLATTGFPGFILYQSFYAILLFKSLRLMKGSEPIFRYQLKVVVIIVLTLMLLGVGAPWHADPAVYGLLGALSAYAGLLKRLPNSESTNHLTSEQDFVSVLGFHG